MTIAAIQAHVLSRKLELPPRARDLERQLRNTLIHASDTHALLTPPHEVFQLVKLSRDPPPNIAGQLVGAGLRANAFFIEGGDKNQERNPARRHFKRNDGAWFDFTIAVCELRDGLEFLAYDFEIRFPPGCGTPFLRLDLNPPAHTNTERDLRAHMHPGSDDILVPTPLLSPHEVLTLFTDGLRLPAHRDKPRNPTIFEVDWFRDTHAALVGRG
jgi:hypothetical protein